ncbi:uncharacterized protein MONBRDRAFT_12159 [Monosiga brevicollis MX1]|uniref:Sulfotransferase domain-containing protein n=1 Tax=Monosiga brevicollis TaxID=81824 RepID=A9VBE2_MONBE|nr:uncharacterized protein MONBRDRAFT_12159 [Monosiga brevicollis MX1]EDQ85221.1 predicted protein [Monosiga brevicollis MX1]|eukprot:XP_001750046.1 hypothetical protein [Monosiga brevicollis MX1]
MVMGLRGLRSVLPQGLLALAALTLVIGVVEIGLVSQRQHVVVARLGAFHHPPTPRLSQQHPQHQQLRVWNETSSPRLGQSHPLATPRRAEPVPSQPNEAKPTRKKTMHELWEEQQKRLLAERHDAALATPPNVTLDEFDAAHARAGPLGAAVPLACSFHNKVTRECGTGQGQLPVLITGVGRSGTHHTESSLRHMGINVCHEAACRDGSVSWIYAVQDPDRFYPWENANYRLKDRRFGQVFHQVRHPLRVIASLTTYEGMSWKFIAKHTPAVPGLASMHPLRKALIHWVTWNRWVELHADWRFRMEDTPVAELCHRLSLPGSKCEQEHHAARRDQRFHANVTWGQLRRADPFWAQAARELAHRYGYADALVVAMDGEDDDE